jgi:hypothetical protein
MQLMKMSGAKQLLPQVRGFAPIGMLEYSIIPCGLPIEWPQKAL